MPYKAELIEKGGGEKRFHGRCSRLGDRERPKLEQDLNMEK